MNQSNINNAQQGRKELDMSNAEIAEYIGKFCRRLITGFREALPECCDVIPEEDCVTVWPHNTDLKDKESTWVTISSWDEHEELSYGINLHPRLTLVEAGYYAWCSNLPLSHTSKLDYSATDSLAKRGEIRKKAREVLVSCLKEFTLIDLDESAVYETDWNGWFRPVEGPLKGSMCSTRHRDTDVVVSNSEMIVFDPEQITLKKEEA